MNGDSSEEFTRLKRTGKLAPEFVVRHFGEMPSASLACLINISDVKSLKLVDTIHNGGGQALGELF